MSFKVWCILGFWGILLVPESVLAQSSHKLLRQADRAYKKEDFVKSEEIYRKTPFSETTQYNLGNTLMQQKRYDDAIFEYNKAIEKTRDKNLKSEALYNRGNAYFWKQDYKTAIADYQQALLLKPSDGQAKRNLVLAKKFLKQQQEEAEKQRQKPSSGTPEKASKSDTPQKPEDSTNTPPSKSDAQADQNPDQNPNKPAQQDLKKEEAKRLLEIMDSEEQKIQQRLKKGGNRPTRSEKDW
jgi:Ca-activated chloride channel homolog